MATVDYQPTPSVSFTPPAAAGPTDITLISRDNISFPSHKLYLTANMMFFEALFAQEDQPLIHQPDANQLPTIQMGEDLEVLEVLLTLIYPSFAPPPILAQNYKMVLGVMAAADKLGSPRAMQTCAILLTS